MNTKRNKIIIIAVAVVVLALVYWWGGNAPGLRGWNPQTDEVTDISETQSGLLNDSREVNNTPAKGEYEPDIPESKALNSSPMTAEEKEIAANKIAEDLPSDNKEEVNNPVSAVTPVPIDPDNVAISDKELSCTLSVRCDTILKNMSWLEPEKVELIPEDGVIFAEKKVTFYEGESVFNLLVREMKRNKIHFEFTNVPVYNSAYIEGIANIYEFDCGELSGWMYKVNDWFPNYGSSRYQLKDGDKVEVIYTCDLGVDIGGYYSKRNGM